MADLVNGPKGRWKVVECRLSNDWAKEVSCAFRKGVLRW